MKKHISIYLVLVAILSLSCERILQDPLSLDEIIGTYKVVAVDYGDNASFLDNVAFWDSLILNQRVVIAQDSIPDPNRFALSHSYAGMHFIYEDVVWQVYFEKSNFGGHHYYEDNPFSGDQCSESPHYTLFAEVSKDGSSVEVTFYHTYCTLLFFNQTDELYTETWLRQ